MSLDFHPLTVGGIEADDRSFGLTSFRRRVVLSVLGALAVTTVLGFVLARRRGQFTAALHTAPVSLLALAAALQIVALLARSEAWNVCVRAAGGTVTRRLLFRAAGIGYLASLVNGSVGMAVRIALPAPHRAADRSPCTGTGGGRGSDHHRRSRPGGDLLVHADRAARRPLVGARDRSRDHDWGREPLCGGSRERHRTGLWAGLAILHKDGRGRMIAFTLLSVCAQVARNWLMLRAIGVNVSVFDAMALLIAMFTLGQLPIGPSIGPAAAVLILGDHGIAATAAAGVLLTVTGVVGTLCYAAWAITDRIVTGRRSADLEPVVKPLAATSTSA